MSWRLASLGFIAALLLAALVPGQPAAGQTISQINVCYQNFHLPKQPGVLPGGECKATKEMSGLEQLRLQLITQAILQVLNDQNTAPEIQNLFADPSSLVVCFYITRGGHPSPPYNPSPCSPPPSSKPTVLNVELDKAISWVAWDRSSVPKKLMIGIANRVFDSDYNLAVHETAELLQSMWWPGTFDQATMPHFMLNTSDGHDWQQLAIYAIIAHEIAHFFNSDPSIYPNDTAAKSCTDQASFPAHTFASESWQYDQTVPTEYFPPWDVQGVWGCPLPGVDADLNSKVRSYAPFNNGKPTGNQIKLWPSDVAQAWLNEIYTQSKFPSVMASTSPEEDFADSYTFLALYRAGLKTFCLVVPTDSTSPHDVMYQLFKAGSLFWGKANWLIQYFKMNEVPVSASSGC